MNELMRRLLGLPEQASTVARSIDHLHFLVILATMAGAAAVGLAAVGFAVRYRRRPGDAAAAPRPGRLGLEWVAMGGLLTLFVWWWWLGYRQYLTLQVAPPGAMTVYVSAKQWMWKFAYPDGRRSLSLLVVPTGRPVQLLMSSRDVIHGFFVPDFRVKHDVMPGAVSTLWFEVDRPGVHEILCTQYCGTSHAKMRGAVVALSPADFAAWGNGSDPAPLRRANADFAAERAAMSWDGPEDDGARADGEADLPTRGRALAARYGCLACHTTDGQRHIGPSWRGLFASRVDLGGGRTTVADEAYLTRSMMEPQVEVVAGYAPLMPSYQGLLDPFDAAAIVEFIKTLQGADPGPAGPPLPTVVPPATVPAVPVPLPAQAAP
jgi:cytochrome c oxidase subunit 2